MNSPLLPSVTLEPSAHHRASIIWLHGLGADGHDFEPIARELRLPEELGVRFLFPHAPQRPVTINGGYVMRAWYDIASAQLDQSPDAEGIEASRQAIERLIDHENECGVPAERIVLAGFSQGGVIALETGLQRQEGIAGVIALSCYAAFPGQQPPATRPLPIFMAHGTEDTLVPHRLGRSAGDELLERGYALEWREYPMPHSVCGEEIRDIRHWLVDQLS